MPSAAGANRSGGVRVDAASTFPDGTPIDGVAGLRAFIVKHQDSYVQTFVAKMLTYALGRHLDYRDQPVVRADCAGCGRIGSSLVGYHSRYRDEHAVPHGQDQLMMITKKALSRRTVLRGLGAAVSLPLLDAMVPSLTALQLTPAQPRMRFGAVYVPNGVIPGQWFPTAEGSAFEFSPSLKPLEKIPRSHAGHERSR